MRPEIAAQYEFLRDMNLVKPEDEVYVKPANDALKLTNTSSLCIFSVETIVSAGSEIGVVGAVKGGDSYDELKDAGKPFFWQVRELAEHPIVKTKYGDVQIKIRIGGDMVNLLGIVQ